MAWSVRPLAGADSADVAAVFRASRHAEMPWLPILHTPEEDVAFFAGEIETSESWAAVIDGRLVGFALARDGWLNHLYVDPEWRRRGVGSSLLARVTDAMPDAVQLWTFQRNETALRFYEGHGFEVVTCTDGSANEEREPDVHLRRTPPVSVRRAVPSDADLLARLHVRTWQTAYAGLVDAGYLARLDAVERAQRWRERLDDEASGVTTIMAVSADDLVGFMTVGPPRDADLDHQRPPWVEVYAVYVEPGHWRQGIGSRLWDAVERGWGPEVAGVALWVLRDNARARAFYGARGLAPDGAERSVPLGGQDVAEVRMVGRRLELPPMV
jgi:GNAT superfamily N-acetyltransferase